MSKMPLADQRDVEVQISLSLKRLTNEQKMKLADRRWFEREKAIHEVASELALMLSQQYEIRSRPSHWQGPSMISDGRK